MAEGIGLVEVPSGEYIGPLAACVEEEESFSTPPGPALPTSDAGGGLRGRMAVPPGDAAAGDASDADAAYDLPAVVFRPRSLRPDLGVAISSPPGHVLAPSGNGAGCDKECFAEEASSAVALGSPARAGTQQRCWVVPPSSEAWSEPATPERGGGDTGCWLEPVATGASVVTQAATVTAAVAAAPAAALARAAPASGGGRASAASVARSTSVTSSRGGTPLGSRGRGSGSGSGRVSTGGAQAGGGGAGAGVGRQSSSTGATEQQRKSSSRDRSEARPWHTSTGTASTTTSPKTERRSATVRRSRSASQSRMSEALGGSPKAQHRTIEAGRSNGGSDEPAAAPVRCPMMSVPISQLRRLESENRALKARNVVLEAENGELTVELEEWRAGVRTRSCDTTTVRLKQRRGGATGGNAGLGKATVARRNLAGVEQVIEDWDDLPAQVGVAIGRAGFAQHRRQVDATARNHTVAVTMGTAPVAAGSSVLCAPGRAAPASAGGFGDLRLVSGGSATIAMQVNSPRLVASPGMSPQCGSRGLTVQGATAQAIATGVSRSATPVAASASNPHSMASRFVTAGGMPLAPQHASVQLLMAQPGQQGQAPLASPPRPVRLFTPMGVPAASGMPLVTTSQRTGTANGVAAMEPVAASGGTGDSGGGSAAVAVGSVCASPAQQTRWVPGVSASLGPSSTGATPPPTPPPPAAASSDDTIFG
eukprot:CAMPEP_0180749680 /NCGR_PEP_ID=MMETSP1038_2-20121128/30720_1 /TAXON_ID=632150 /ORGANISM="Azadinium spinosum, Strain 3D9" /LENGTH=707 /DNA_ID=CAMNT_0022783399 /DNA_START=1 /DNA_END=2123 /DNA_ORIENTATION=+